MRTDIGNRVLASVGPDAEREVRLRPGSQSDSFCPCRATWHPRRHQQHRNADLLLALRARDCPEADFGGYEAVEVPPGAPEADADDLPPAPEPMATSGRDLARLSQALKVEKRYGEDDDTDE